MLLRESRSRRYIRSDSQIRDCIHIFKSVMKPFMIEHDSSLAFEKATQFFSLERQWCRAWYWSSVMQMLRRWSLSTRGSKARPCCFADPWSSLRARTHRISKSVDRPPDHFRCISIANTSKSWKTWKLTLACLWSCRTLPWSDFVASHFLQSTSPAFWSANSLAKQLECLDSFGSSTT